ncbi:hypothetical protein QUF74_07415 [Candidatus Halobeggiatoa sp. HSG11]|nr:hypothetical protein [Candidatus Halobeggiatoa sp. HSG11]
MNGWILRPYPYEINRMERFLQDDFVAIGWPGIGDLYDCDRSIVYKKLFDLYSTDFGDIYCRNSANAIWKFKDNISVGELVLAVPFKDDSLEVAVGRIDSSYYFNRKYDETVTANNGYNGFSHRRKVVWLEKRLPRSLLPTPIKKSFNNSVITQISLEGYNRLVEFLESRGHDKLDKRWQMSQHRKQMIETSMKIVLESIQQPELTEIFNEMASHIVEIFRESKSVNYFDLLVSNLVHVAAGMNVNLFPVDVNNSCKRHCISIAFEQWNATNGFNAIAKQTMTYWLECLNDNVGTIFFTSAWDEIDFITNYKKQFDAYAKQHDIVVILVTANGFSIVYSG